MCLAPEAVVWMYSVRKGVLKKFQKIHGEKHVKEPHF